MARPASRRVVITVATLLVALLLAAGSVVGYVSWRSAEELVHPERQVPVWTPADAGLAYERVGFDTRDGVRLVGWWMPADAEGAATVIVLHGYGDSKNQALDVAPFLHASGYHVLAFDLRAHGESGGDFTTVGLLEVADVQAAHAWLAGRPDADAQRVALLGFSMGAATAVHAAAGMPDVDAVIADSGFATLQNIASNSITHFTGLPKYPFGPLSVAFAGWMVGSDVSENAPVHALERLHAPVLVIQGLDDPIVRPDDDGRALYEAAPAGSELWMVPDAAHVAAQDVAPAAYEARVLAFLARALPPPADT